MSLKLDANASLEAKMAKLVFYLEACRLAMTHVDKNKPCSPVSPMMMYLNK